MLIGDFSALTKSLQHRKNILDNIFIDFSNMLHPLSRETVLKLMHKYRHDTFENLYGNLSDIHKQIFLRMLYNKYKCSTNIDEVISKWECYPSKNVYIILWMNTDHICYAMNKPFIIVQTFEKNDKIIYQDPALEQDIDIMWYHSRLPIVRNNYQDLVFIS